MAAWVKVFGCRQASENRPSTNPRGCGDGLWGFRVFARLGWLRSRLGSAVGGGSVREICRPADDGLGTCCG
jgi:hypothetical protein